jgi:hypothetical protein
MRRSCLALLGLVLVFLVPAAANAAIGSGVYGDVARFDRLTGQRTQSGLAFIGWDQGRTYGKPYSYFLQTLGDRPHIALQTIGVERRSARAASRSARATRTCSGSRRRSPRPASPSCSGSSAR